MQKKAFKNYHPSSVKCMHYN
uniref:Uncharacterized protein n=1 Tax=Anguilla anguilla TaxID=7936 RepID=A0A0E9ULG6_ANGAN